MKQNGIDIENYYLAKFVYAIVFNNIPLDMDGVWIFLGCYL